MFIELFYYICKEYRNRTSPVPSRDTAHRPLRDMESLWLKRMKTITFFNEKGGMGKTTFSVMFASWLKYSKGYKVLGMDFDNPNFPFLHIRKTDQALLDSGEKNLREFCDGRAPYEIKAMTSADIGSEAGLTRTITALRRMREEGGEGYVVIDFPGRFQPNDPIVKIASAGQIDLFVFPIDTDAQSQRSALRISQDMLRSQRFRQLSGKPSGQSILFFWNRVTRGERQSTSRDWFDAMNDTLGMMGIPVATEMMPMTESAKRDADTFGFIRSTMCWPERNIKMRCPNIIKLFEEIKRHLDNAK